MATATVFREFFAVLSDSIQDPDDLAKSLYSKCLITKSVRDEATHVMYTRDKKTDVLLKAVESRIAIAREDPETLDVFLAVLRQPPHNLGKLCGRIRDTYGMILPCSILADIIIKYSRRFGTQIYMS